MKTKEQRKKEKKHLIDFDLVKGTTGIILNGVYIKKDKSELIISMAWGKDLYFRPLKENEKSL